MDPLLFAVPLPIDSIEATETCKEGETKTVKSKKGVGKINTISTTSEPDSIHMAAIVDGKRACIFMRMTVNLIMYSPSFSLLSEFEHVFPTTEELREAQTVKLARKHICRLLKAGVNSNTKNKLKDPHLLLYLSSFLDDSALAMLCEYINDKSPTRAPAKLSMSLDMLKMSFDDSTGSEDEDDA